jgi:hypothetical protein
VRIVASGGALDDATFVVNVFIAIGTIGATSVALWLAWSARLASVREGWRRREQSARQVVGVLRVPDDRTQFDLDIVNGGSDVIVKVSAMVDYLDHSALGSPHNYSWRRDSESAIPFILGSDSATSTGQLSSYVAGETPLVIPEDFIFQADLLLWWQDSGGAYWARRGLNDPYITEGAMPGRVIKDFYAPVTLRERIRHPGRTWMELRLSKRD